MSLEQHAFITRQNVPSATAWQAAITQLGFDLQLDPALKPHEDSGYLPCKLGQTAAGFEIYYESAEELLNEYPHIKERLSSRDYAISFRWGGDMAECACVLIASAALAKSCDAVVYYPADDLFYTVDELIDEAGQALSEIDADAQAQNAAPVGSTKRWWEFWK